MQDNIGLSKRLLCTLLALSFFVLGTGCSSKGTVSGKVAYKGTPLTKGMVRFLPNGAGGSFDSEIEPDGTYSIKKVPPGPAKIVILTPKPPNMPKMPGGATGGGAEWPPKGVALPEGVDLSNASPTQKVDTVNIPADYSDAEKTPLKYDVKNGSQTFDIEIK